ncbi:helix-turn-helix transcriptional regulator [Pelagibius litoralis]|uniref:Helix-turn-helix transcriptional regulator n=1 Tax=Pelagibius litoralis TaxID=374515 RepID=A0A967K7Y6_9PROT|nr:metalloregulator ArsR/SmtB family transcription factor [Pelagibius litoralis]NIA70123.1 helix-turn-helix transcriptional regulator [Pelagibius litoralis]
MSYGPLLLTAGRASRLLKAMGNERRLVILCHLSEREHSVTELCRLVGLSQSALSQHLAKLRRDSLVKTRRNAQTVLYSVASPDVGKMLAALSDLFANTADGKAYDFSAEKSGGAEAASEGAALGKSST